MCLEQSASHWLPSFVNWASLGGTLSLFLNLSKRNSNYTSAQPHTLVGSEDSISKITQPLTFMIMLLHHQENGHTYGLWPLRREQYHRRKISVEWNKHRNKPMRARAHTHTHTHTHTQFLSDLYLLWVLPIEQKWKESLRYMTTIIM